MLHWSRRLVVVLVLAIACSVGLGCCVWAKLDRQPVGFPVGQQQPAGFRYFVSLGPDAVPILMNAIDTQWMFHAYIPQRQQAVKVMAAINDPAALPILKKALTFEPTIRAEAVDAVLAVPGLSIGGLFAELMMEQIDYQIGQLEILRKLYNDNEDVIKVLAEMFEVLAQTALEQDTVDKTADMIARFIIEEKTEAAPPQPLTREQLIKAFLEQQQSQAARGAITGGTPAWRCQCSDPSIP